MRQWTESERRAIDDAVADIDRRAHNAAGASLEALIVQWAAFVHEIERGYAMSIYDYANDLSTRDILDDIMSRTPPGVQQAIRAELAPLDDRYRLATKSCERAILPGPDVAQNSRWWRVPRRLEGELREDLINEGIIADL